VFSCRTESATKPQSQKALRQQETLKGFLKPRLPQFPSSLRYNRNPQGRQNQSISSGSVPGFEGKCSVGFWRHVLGITNHFILEIRREVTLHGLFSTEHVLVYGPSSKKKNIRVISDGAINKVTMFQKSTLCFCFHWGFDIRKSEEGKQFLPTRIKRMKRLKIKMKKLKKEKKNFNIIDKLIGHRS